MKLVAVDVGNSSIKAGLVPIQPGLWTTVYRWKTPQEFQLTTDGPLTWLIASVNRSRSQQLTHWIEANRKQDRIQLLDWTHVPLNIQVDAPQLVGMDRLCAAVAGHAIADQKPCIVVDIGTAVTVDAVSGNADFLGGNIFVGLRGALDQLAQSTDALPRLEIPTAPDEIDAFGKSTAQAMRSGAVLAIVGGISEIVGRMQTSFHHSAQVILTGGDAPLLKSLLQFQALLVEHLVLDGVVKVGQRLANAYDRQSD